MSTKTPLQFLIPRRGLGVVMLGAALLGSSLAISSLPALAGTRTNTLLPGTRFATESFINDTGVSGPTVMIVGGAHGNEPAGAAAAATIAHWPIATGKLVVVPRANVPALLANRRNTPNLSTNLSNLNRNFPRAGKTEPARGDLAEAIWALALEHQPGWLLDLHEGFDFNQVNEKSVGSSIIVFPDDKGRAAADLMLAAVNTTITNAELKFVRRNLPIDGSLARAGGEHLKIPAMTVETTSKQPLEKRVRQHEIMVHRLLHHLGMIGEAIPPASLVNAEGSSKPATASAPQAAAIRVALYKGPGTGGKGPPSLMKRLDNAPLSSITQITPEEIRGGSLTNYDVIIFGGGSGSKEAEGIGETGREAVKEFVANGGGYIGICAGAYLATSGYPWSLGLVNARTVSPKWQRGRAPVKLELTSPGRTILGEREGQFDCLYANGPIIKPDTKTNLPPFETLAYFRSEVSSNGSPVGVMIDSPAIFSGQYQQGRVVCVSPHPEQTEGLYDIVPNAILWVTSKDKKLAGKPAPKGE
jgi:predicted deacylase